MYGCLNEQVEFIAASGPAKAIDSGIQGRLSTARPMTVKRYRRLFDGTVFEHRCAFDPEQPEGAGHARPFAIIDEKGVRLGRPRYHRRRFNSATLQVNGLALDRDSTVCGELQQQMPVRRGELSGTVRYDIMKRIIPFRRTRIFAALADACDRKRRYQSAKN